ncbi:hypothetical protein N7495_009479 [Penicillium taxi]|uniref:uncharacterized protein n=1 Tax=Penicillium taxi TaxID=168475 RepID=UPI0025458C6E|nr:uncharacterized protein N7495_009479 [Penicillium taxi]KAJ5884969.1 hypothetical protein N7495_009479 [Penicillium taxi]
MGSFGSFLFIYVLGGLTFIPLVISLILLYAYLTLPDVASSQQTYKQASEVRRPTDDENSLKSGTDELAEQFHRTHDSDVAAGYFAVCREYVPGGVNGKPPERTTPAGEVVAAESPSVYQTMYRSLFDRKQTPSIEPTKSNGKNTKRARNIFYIVLRHGHLMLYDDESQVEVRYVISLAHHDVSIHGADGEGEIPEGELWIKRNAICLSRRLNSLGDLGGPTPPFYLFSENLSEKEDFYFAMLQNQSKLWEFADRPPKPREFDIKNIVTLVQRLHSSEEQLQTRWINAFLGRLFLALYKTSELEQQIRNKISKKIARVNKPNFISKIGLQKIDLGEGAPFITNPRLKDLTADGNCCVEADLQYTGNFRVEVSATVRIDLGPRFKAREVDIVLAVVLKKLEGHLLVRFKPAPSNRIWMAFETMPKMEMDIEPIVSSKQITFSLILRTIESKIREVVAESIVLPFWDDIPFLDTMGQPFRGGLWRQDTTETSEQTEIPDESGDAPTTPQSVPGDNLDALKSKDDRTKSMPVLSDSVSSKVTSRRGLKSSSGELQKNVPTATSTGVERPVYPRGMRSQAFSSAADPVVTPDNAKVDKVLSEAKTKGEEKSGAASGLIEISNRSPPISPAPTPSSSPPTGGLMVPESAAVHSRQSSFTESVDGLSTFNDHIITSPMSARFDGNSISSPRMSRGSSSASLTEDSKPRRRSTMEILAKSFGSSSSDDKPNGSLTVGSATAAAKKWSMSVFRKGDSNTDQQAPSPAPGNLDQPIGRGHPHLPPGAPLPRPDKYALKRNATSNTLPKRKPVVHSELADSLDQIPASSHTLPRRKPIPPHLRTNIGTDELLVVEAPFDSTPNSPAVGDVDLEDNSAVPILPDSETSSKTDLTGTDSKWNDGDEQDTKPLESPKSLDRTISSSPESENLLPPEVLQVPSA